MSCKAWLMHVYCHLLSAIMQRGACGMPKEEQIEGKEP